MEEADHEVNSEHVELFLSDDLTYEFAFDSISDDDNKPLQESLECISSEEEIYDSELKVKDNFESISSDSSCGIFSNQEVTENFESVSSGEDELVFDYASDYKEVISDDELFAKSECDSDDKIVTKRSSEEKKVIRQNTINCAKTTDQNCNKNKSECNKVCNLASENRCLKDKQRISNSRLVEVSTYSLKRMEDENKCKKKKVMHKGSEVAKVIKISDALMQAGCTGGDSGVNKKMEKSDIDMKSDCKGRQTFELIKEKLCELLEAHIGTFPARATLKEQADKATRRMNNVVLVGDLFLLKSIHNIKKRMQFSVDYICKPCLLIRDVKEIVSTLKPEGFKRTLVICSIGFFDILEMKLMTEDSSVQVAEKVFELMDLLQEDVKKYCKGFDLVFTELPFVNFCKILGDDVKKNFTKKPAPLNIGVLNGVIVVNSKVGGLYSKCGYLPKFLSIKNFYASEEEKQNLKGKSPKLAGWETYDSILGHESKNHEKFHHFLKHYEIEVNKVNTILLLTNYEYDINLLSVHIDKKLLLLNCVSISSKICLDKLHEVINSERVDDILLVIQLHLKDFLELDNDPSCVDHEAHKSINLTETYLNTVIDLATKKLQLLEADIKLKHKGIKIVFGIIPVVDVLIFQRALTKVHNEETEHNVLSKHLFTKAYQVEFNKKYEVAVNGINTWIKNDTIKKGFQLWKMNEKVSLLKYLKPFKLHFQSYKRKEIPKQNDAASKILSSGEGSMMKKNVDRLRKESRTPSLSPPINNSQINVGRPIEKITFREKHELNRKRMVNSKGSTSNFQSANELIVTTTTDTNRNFGVILPRSENSSSFIAGREGYFDRHHNRNMEHAYQRTSNYPTAYESMLTSSLTSKKQPLQFSPIGQSSLNKLVEIDIGYNPVRAQSPRPSTSRRSCSPEKRYGSLFKRDAQPLKSIDPGNVKYSPLRKAPSPYSSLSRMKRSFSPLRNFPGPYRRPQSPFITSVSNRKSCSPLRRPYNPLRSPFRNGRKSRSPASSPKRRLYSHSPARRPFSRSPARRPLGHSPTRRLQGSSPTRRPLGSSPTRRLSGSKISHSPRREFHSPFRRISSPNKKQSSPIRRPRSPARRFRRSYGRSPSKRSCSPAKRSHSPFRKKNISPRRSSGIPNRSYNSPGRSNSSNRRSSSACKNLIIDDRKLRKSPKQSNSDLKRFQSPNQILSHSPIVREEDPKALYSPSMSFQETSILTGGKKSQSEYDRSRSKGTLEITGDYNWSDDSLDGVPLSFGPSNSKLKNTLGKDHKPTGILKELWDLHEAECNVYRRNPECFPSYEAEKTKFMEDKAKQIAFGGIFPSASDLAFQWGQFWMSRMEEHFKRNWREKVKERSENKDNFHLKSQSLLNIRPPPADERLNLDLDVKCSKQELSEILKSCLNKKKLNYNVLESLRPLTELSGKLGFLGEQLNIFCFRVSEIQEKNGDLSDVLNVNSLNFLCRLKEKLCDFLKESVSPNETSLLVKGIQKLGEMIEHSRQSPLRKNSSLQNIGKVEIDLRQSLELNKKLQNQDNMTSKQTLTSTKPMLKKAKERKLGIADSSSQNPRPPVYRNPGPPVYKKSADTLSKQNPPPPVYKNPAGASSSQNPETVLYQNSGIPPYQNPQMSYDPNWQCFQNNALYPYGSNMGDQMGSYWDPSMPGSYTNPSFGQTYYNVPAPPYYHPGQPPWR